MEKEEKEEQNQGLGQEGSWQQGRQPDKQGPSADAISYRAQGLFVVIAGSRESWGLLFYFLLFSFFSCLCLFVYLFGVGFFFVCVSVVFRLVFCCFVSCDVWAAVQTGRAEAGEGRVNMGFCPIH